MMDFEKPIYLWALWALLPWGYLIWQLERWSIKSLNAAFTTENRIRLSPGRSRSPRILKNSLRALAFSLAVIALANPQLDYREVPVERKGMEIVYAFDVSQSMLCEDIKPSRLQKARQVIQTSLNQRAGDRVAIVIYAGNAYPLLPMTHDYAAASLFLSQAAPDQIDRQGTDLAEALRVCAGMFSGESGLARTVVLVTDGEDHSGDVEQAADELEREAIAVFAVGVGSSEGGPIPLRDRSGQLSGYLRDAEGETVLSKARPDLLKSLTSELGGAYLSGADSRIASDELERAWASMDRKLIETKDLKQKDSLFPLFVALAALALIADFLIPQVSYRNSMLKHPSR